MPSLKHCIEAYIHAKDGNRPHLMEAAFEEQAELVTRVRTDDIAFPPHLTGRDAITSIMVSQFAQRYENVYTFCIGAPPTPDALAYATNWLVCMTQKDDGAARLGSGRYEWLANAGRISRLVITIDEMRVLGREIAAPMLGWARSLPYPWCAIDQLERRMPQVEALRRVARELRCAGAR
ncbi:hypothetical protein [Paraburkholderia ferrariae]|uniref:hypothetical protein n=1 Tax=Paraburkholderia ferrariae TaxID=386056 RepID=UPI00047FDD10|nr:hypothetical protein [Paraburkholderia ferrariae]